MSTSDLNGVRDFTARSEPIRFRIEPDDFAAPGVVNPIVLARFAKQAEEIQTVLGEGLTIEKMEHAIGLAADIFRTLIGGGSGERFAQRLRDGSINLIAEALPVMSFLLEQWTGRPTQQSTPSLDGSTNPAIPSVDTSGVDTASAEGLTQTD